MGIGFLESLESRCLFAAAAPGGGLRGEYFANEDFTGASIVRQDAVVTFNFFNGELAPGIDADTAAFVRLASGLAGTLDGAKYRAAADATLASLASPAYLNTRNGRGLLLHGAKWVARNAADNSLIYVDYYFLEAINRYNGLP